MKTREMKKLLNEQNQIISQFSKNIDKKFKSLDMSINEIKNLLMSKDINVTNHSSNSAENLYFFIPRSKKSALKNGKNIKFYYLSNGQLKLSPEMNLTNFKDCKKYLIPSSIQSRMQSLIDRSNYGRYIYGNFNNLKKSVIRESFKNQFILLNSKNKCIYEFLPKESKLNVYNQVTPVQKVINPKFRIKNKNLVKKSLQPTSKFKNKELVLCPINEFIKKANLNINTILNTDISNTLKPACTYSLHPILTNEYKKVLLTDINNIKLAEHANQNKQNKELKILNKIKKFAPSLKFYKSLKDLIDNSDDTQINNYLRVWIQYYHISYNKLAKFHVNYLLRQLMLGIFNHKSWEIKYILHRLSLYVPINNRFVWGNLIQELGVHDNSTQNVELIVTKMLGVIKDNNYIYSKEIQDMKDKKLQDFERATSYIVFTKSSYQNYIHDNANSFDVVTLDDNHVMTYRHVLEDDLVNNDKLKVSFNDKRIIESLSAKSKLAIKPMQYLNVFPRLDCAGDTDTTSLNVSKPTTINSSNIDKTKINNLCKKALTDISESYKFAVNNKDKNGASLSPKLGSNIFKSKLINDVTALKPSLSKFGSYNDLLNEISNESNIKHLYSVVVAYINKLLANYHIDNKNAFSIKSSEISNPKNEMVHQHKLKFSNDDSSKLNALIKQINNKLDGKSNLDDIKLIRDIEELQPYLSDNQFSEVWNDFSNSSLSSDELNRIIKG